MKKEKQKSWFRRHPILTILIVLFVGIPLLIGIIGGFMGGISEGEKTSEPIMKSSVSLLPQDSDIDREWLIDPIESISSDSEGFVDGAGRKIKKAETFSGSTVELKVYRFDSLDNANSYYTQEKQKIDIRGVKEWNLGNDCFGIDRDVSLAGTAEGFCLRNNFVFYTKSVSTSYLHASDGKEFMKTMLNNLN